MRNPGCPNCGKIMDTFADGYWCSHCRTRYTKDDFNASAAHVKIAEQQIIDYLKKHGHASGYDIVNDLGLDPEVVAVVLTELTSKRIVKDHGTQNACPFCGSAKNHVINARWSSTRQLLNMRVDRVCEACGRIF
jgi:predicted RNA-binding Zn-ribbon protein involved in translation (DUF1610 family)